ncbi:MAG: hypothetical protein AB1640_01465 [bacterium]
MQKCHLCNTQLYPGDKRYRLRILIYPASEQDSFSSGGLPTDALEEASDAGAVAEDELWCENGSEAESCHQASLILCEECQDQFLRNPVVKENLLFPARESPPKTIH